MRIIFWEKKRKIMFVISFHITKLMMKIIFVNAVAKTSLHKIKHIIVTVLLIFKGRGNFD
jgi:hypothetical protein